MANEEPQVLKSASFVYRLTLKKSISSTDKSPDDLVLEQGVQTKTKSVTDEVSYYVKLHGVKVNRKIYQPTEIEAELDFMLITNNTQSGMTAPSFEAVSAMLLQRRVELDVIHVNRMQDSTETVNTGNSYTVAKNCYVYEIDPQLKRDKTGPLMFVKLSIFSMDKLMTLNKYSKAYVARKLGSGILKPESFTFGKDGENPLIETDITGLRFLKYYESVTYTKDGNKSTGYIPSEFIQPYLVQYNESFYDFMVRTSNRCGEFLYFEDGKLTLGLRDSGEPVRIDEYETVTKQSISAAPLVIEDYARDSVKSGNGDVSYLNHTAIEKEDTGFPKDAFADNISSNAELAYDEYIFPLFKDKFSHQHREMYYDGDGHHVAMARLIPFFRTLFGNETDGVVGLGASIAKHAAVEEGIMNLKAFFQVGTANTAGQENYLDPWNGKVEQYDKNKVVQFSSLKEEGWTTLNYYNDVHKHEVEQQRHIVCINMGTDYVGVKLGQKIKVDGLKGTYVVIQIEQVSEESWNHDYDKYDEVAADKYTGRRSQKIYAIPSYIDEKDEDKEKFIPPVQPVPVVRKVGPQTAFVTANVDPKYQGRVRVAYPWQSLGSAVKNQMAVAEQKLQEAQAEKDRLENLKMTLPDLLKTLNDEVDELKKYVNATEEDRKNILEDKMKQRSSLETEIAKLQKERAALDEKLAALESDIEKMKHDSNAQKSEEEKKKVELEEYKKAHTTNAIQQNDAEIAAKKKEIEQLDENVEELQAAAAEHDEKKGKEDYKDIEKDNTVIARKKRAYDRAVRDNKDCQKKLNAAEQVVKEREKQKETVKEYIEKSALSMSTPWIRVVSPMATPGGGAFFRPRVGDEVLINYDNDNVERPYVVGSLFSKNTLTPDEGLYRKAAPELQWKNISMQIMSPNGHHITFTDPEGGAGFLTNALSPGLGFYASLVGLNDLGKNYKDLAGGIHIGDRYGMYEIEMKSHKRAIDIKSPFGTVSINAFQGITIKAPNGDVKIQGKNITLEAGNKITLLSGKNIQEPEIGDPEGKGNYIGKMVVSTLGTILEAGVAPDFIESVVDFSLIRTIVETFARPVDGTLLLKSKRFLKLEAGPGNATIKRDRYRDPKPKNKLMTLLQGEEKDRGSMEEFYKVMVEYVNYINEKVDEFYGKYERLWKNGWAKRMAYHFFANKYLSMPGEPDLVAAVKDSREWKEGIVSFKLYKDKFDMEKDGNAHTKMQMFNELKGEARLYAKSLYDMNSHASSFMALFADAPEHIIDGCNIKEKVLPITIQSVFPDAYTDWKDDTFIYMNMFAAENSDETDFFSKDNLTVVKRKLILAFLYLVAHDEVNAGNKYIKIEYDIAYIKKTHTFNQEYYWKRQVQIMDHYIQKHKFLRTVIENTVTKFVDKFKSNFAPFDRDIWTDRASGQILFSENEGSTLNFQGEGLHEESDSNIGTMAHLKKVLMEIQ